MVEILTVVGGAAIPGLLSASQGPGGIIGRIAVFVVLMIGVVAVLVIVAKSNEDEV